MKHTYRLNVVMIKNCRIFKVNSMEGELFTVFTVSDGGRKIKTGFHVINST